MLRDAFESPAEHAPEELKRQYEDRLAETVEKQGVETVAESTDIDVEVLSGLLDGEQPELTLEEATAILATDEEYPDAETLLLEARDILLMGMSIAVLDVEAVASGLNDRMEPKEIQQKMEGRYPITLEEYALLHHYIESEKR